MICSNDICVIKDSTAAQAFKLELTLASVEACKSQFVTVMLSVISRGWNRLVETGNWRAMKNTSETARIGHCFSSPILLEISHKKPVPKAGPQFVNENFSSYGIFGTRPSLLVEISRRKQSCKSRYSQQRQVPKPKGQNGSGNCQRNTFVTGDPRNQPAIALREKHLAMHDIQTSIKKS